MSRILLIDSNPIFRLGLCSLVRAAQPLLNISEAENFALGRAALRERRDISLVMLDLEVPDGGGFFGLSQLRKEFSVPVILLSSDNRTEDVGRAIASGALAFIHKSSPCEAILRALKTVLSGQAGPVPIISTADDINPIASLSPALVRVLMGVKRGLRNKEIAFELGLSEKTIKAYLNTLYRKLGVSNRTQAVILTQDMLTEAETANVTEPVAANVA